MGGFKVDGNPLHITVQSVVRRGLELEQVTNILQTLQLLQPFGEQAMQQVNVSELVKFIFEKTDFPSALIQEEPTQGSQPTDAQQQPAVEQLQALAENVLPQVMGNMEE